MVLLLLTIPTFAYKKVKRGGMGTARRDSDGFSLFGKAKKDSDAYYPRSKFDDDDSKLKPSKRNNLYAAKKMD